MITESITLATYKDGGTKKVEYVEDGMKKICFIDYSINTKKRGSVYDNMFGSNFYNELNPENSAIIKSLLENEK